MLRQIQVAAALLALTALGCSSKKSEGDKPAPPAESSLKPVNPADAFQVEARVEGKDLLVTVKAKEGFKINDEYPHHFRPEASNTAAVFDKPRYDLWPTGEKTPCAKGPAATCTLETRIPFSSESKSGEAVGVTSFSVCNDDVCLIERVKVSAPLGS